MTVYYNPRSRRRWWLVSYVHNCVVHPLLPLAEAVDYWRPSSRIPRAVFALHDLTVPVSPVEP